MPPSRLVWRRRRPLPAFLSSRGGLLPPLVGGMRRLRLRPSMAARPPGGPSPLPCRPAQHAGRRRAAGLAPARRKGRRAGGEKGSPARFAGGEGGGTTSIGGRRGPLSPSDPLYPPEGMAASSPTLDPFQTALTPRIPLVAAIM